jgi:hypothetical protein
MAFLVLTTIDFGVALITNEIFCQRHSILVFSKRFFRQRNSYFW